MFSSLFGSKTRMVSTDGHRLSKVERTIANGPKLSAGVIIPKKGLLETAEHGTVFLDSRAHKTIYDGCMYATSHGATGQRFQHDDWEHVELLLRASDPNRPDDEQYIVRLLGQVITVSLETLRVVKSLPPIDSPAARTTGDALNAADKVTAEETA